MHQSKNGCSSHVLLSLPLSVDVVTLVDGRLDRGEFGVGCREGRNGEKLI